MPSSSDRSIVKKVGLNEKKGTVGLIRVSHTDALADIKKGKNYLFKRQRVHQDGTPDLTAADYILAGSPSLTDVKKGLSKRSVAVVDDNYALVGRVNASEFEEETGLRGHVRRTAELTPAQAAQRAAIPVVNHADGVFTHEYFEDVMLPKLQEEYTRLPYIKGAIKKMVANGMSEDDAKRHFGSEVLNSIRSILIEAAFKVRMNNTDITAETKRFMHADDATPEQVFTQFRTWRDLNGFNHKLVRIDANPEAKTARGKMVRYQARHYGEWAKHQYEHWAHDIPIDGYVQLNRDAGRAEGDFFRQQDKSETNAARNILRTGERAMEERIRVAYNAHKNGERAPRLE